VASGAVCQSPIANYGALEHSITLTSRSPARWWPLPRSECNIYSRRWRHCADEARYLPVDRQMSHWFQLQVDIAHVFRAFCPSSVPASERFTPVCPSFMSSFRPSYPGPVQGRTSMPSPRLTASVLLSTPVLVTIQTPIRCRLSRIAPEMTATAPIDLRSFAPSLAARGRWLCNPCAGS